MNYRPLGRTGLMVSEIGLGTVELGLNYGVPVAEEHVRPPEEQAARLLNRALDLGVTFIDTARGYGVSEEVIGRALKTRRNEYILATKLAPIRDDGQPDRELREQVGASIAESLRALQTDTVDLLQLHHAPADLVKRGRVLAAIREAQQAGYVRFVGASTYGEEAALAVLEDGGYDVLQVSYNLADKELGKGVLPRAQRHGIGVIARSVLLRGLLTHRYVFVPDQLAELRVAAAQLDRIAVTAGCSLPEMAYRFVLANSTISAALAGTARIEELEAVLAFARQGPLAPAIVAAIQQVTVSDEALLNPGTWPTDVAAWRPTNHDTQR